MGDSARALEHYNRAREMSEGLLATDRANPAYRRALSVAYEHIGTLLLLTGDLDSALAHNRRALELRAALAAEFPLNADYGRTHVVSYYNDGEILAKMSRRREALDSYRKSLSLAERLSWQDPNNEQYRGDVAYALIRVGDMLVALGDPQRALVSYQKSRTLRERDVNADPTNLWKRSSLIEARAKMTKALAIGRQYQAALAASAETQALMAHTRLDPTNANFRGFFADTYIDLGAAHALLARERGTTPGERRDRWRAARTWYQQSLEIWQDLQGRGTLAATDRPKLESVAGEIARCDRMLAESHSSR